MGFIQTMLVRKHFKTKEKLTRPQGVPSLGPLSSLSQPPPASDNNIWVLTPPGQSLPAPKARLTVTSKLVMRTWVGQETGAHWKSSPSSLAWALVVLVESQRGGKPGGTYVPGCPSECQDAELSSWALTVLSPLPELHLSQ